MLKKKEGSLMRDVMKDVENIVGRFNSLDEILNMAVVIEDEGRQFYEKHARDTDNEAAKGLYDYLAKEEAKHGAYIREYMTGGNIPTIKPGDITFKPSFTQEFMGNSLDELGVLLGALRLERKNEYFYAKLASTVKDKAQQEMFDILASFERGHYELIDYIIENTTEFRMQT